VTKDTPGAVRTVEVSKKWYGRYTDGAGRSHRVPLSESKGTARRMLAKLAGDSQLAGVGITDPFAEHRARPLLEHLEDFRSYLAAKGNVPEHVAKTEAQCRAVLEGCKFVHFEDVQPSAVVEFLAKLRRGDGSGAEVRKEWYTVEDLAGLLGISGASVRRMARRGQLAGEGKGQEQRYHREVVKPLLERRGQGVGAQTSNHYLAAIKSFSKWLVKDRRCAVDPLAHLSRVNPDVDLRHPRRALREELFGQFIEATGAGKEFRGLSGPDRLVLYTLAAQTGFRASELGSLTPESFFLGSDAPVVTDALAAGRPTVTVAAGYSKHRREDVQPLRSDVAEMMRQYLTGKVPGKPVWPGAWTEAGAEMVRLDLQAAGIPYQDAAGRFFDFHALRGQFISALAAGGVHPKVAQVLARHSTINLTMDYYTHLDVLDVAGALDKLPAARPTAKPPGDKGEGRKRA
jgi:integrase